MRDREFKYIYFTDPEFPPILFDLKSYPDKLQNLADLAEHAAIELRYCQKLLRWRMCNEDQRMEHWAQPRHDQLCLEHLHTNSRGGDKPDVICRDLGPIQAPTLLFCLEHHLPK